MYARIVQPLLTIYNVAAGTECFAVGRLVAQKDNRNWKAADQRINQKRFRAFLPN